MWCFGRISFALAIFRFLFLIILGNQQKSTTRTTVQSTSRSHGASPTALPERFWTWFTGSWDRRVRKRGAWTFLADVKTGVVPNSDVRGNPAGWCPSSLAKLVNISPISLWFLLVINIPCFHGIISPNKWGGTTLQVAISWENHRS